MLFAAFSLSAHPQFREYKNNYSVKDYNFQPTDRYNPKVATACAIFPGGGHLYSGEPLRGLIFPAGMLASSYFIVDASLGEWAAGWGSENSNREEIQMVLAVSAFLGFYIWNFTDAARVAKIKNLYSRDQNFSLRLIPYAERGNKYPFNSNTAGFNLKVTY